MLRTLAVFVFICVCGVFCGLVGGVEWDAPEVAYLSTITLLWGFVGALITAVVYENGE